MGLLLNNLLYSVHRRVEDRGPAASGTILLIRRMFASDRAHTSLCRSGLNLIHPCWLNCTTSVS